MANLLDETIEFLKERGKMPEDVQWVNCNKKSFSWEEFCALANFTYDNGYGSQQIDESLEIIGKDWLLERYEYDGSEWWKFKTPPKRYSNHKPIVQQDLINKDYRNRFKFTQEED